MRNFTSSGNNLGKVGITHFLPLFCLCRSIDITNRANEPVTRMNLLEKGFCLLFFMICAKSRNAGTQFDIFCVI